MKIELPWPDRVLHPNARTHHMAKAKVAKAVRLQAFYTALSATPFDAPEQGNVLVTMDFFPPDSRRRDLDGMLSASKNQLDGIADAIKVNDNRFALLIRRQDPAPPHGKVVVTVEARP